MSWELVKQVETAAAARQTDAQAAAAIDWCLKERSVVSLDMAFKWIDLFGAPLAPTGLDSELRKAIESNRKKPWRYEGDLEIELDENNERRSARRIAIVASPGSAKGRELRDRLPPQQVSYFEVDAHYPCRAYRTATAAWYPPSQTPIGNAPPLEDSTQLRSLSELPRRVPTLETLVIILGMPRVPEWMIDMFPCGIINAHNGLLPYFRGLDSPAWAYMHGARLGYSIHYIDRDLDCGTVLARKALLAGTKSEFDQGMVNALAEIADAVLRGRRLAERKIERGDYFYRTSLPTRRILDSLARA